MKLAKEIVGSAFVLAGLLVGIVAPRVGLIIETIGNRIGESDLMP